MFREGCFVDWGGGTKLAPMAKVSGFLRVPMYPPIISFFWCPFLVDSLLLAHYDMTSLFRDGILLAAWLVTLVKFILPPFLYFVVPYSIINLIPSFPLRPPLTSATTSNQRNRLKSVLDSIILSPSPMAPPSPRRNSQIPVLLVDYRRYVSSPILSYILRDRER